MSTTTAKQAQRADAFKKGIDPEDARRRREDLADALRKQKRDNIVSKRRMGGVGTVLQEPTPLAPGLGLPSGSEVVSEEKLQQLVAGVHSNDPNTQLTCVTHFRKLLSIERSPPIREVIASGVVPRLVSFLKFNESPTLQFEAAWALTNIASGTSSDTKVVIDHGAVSIFVALLRSPNTDVAEQAVWALGNIAGDSPACRDLVLREGALAPLLQLCNNNAKLSMLRNATWTLSNLCRGKPQPPFDAVSPALPVLAQLLSCRDDEVLTDACWALSYLSDDTGPNNQKIQAVITSGVPRRLVELLMHRSPNVKTPALRTVGNIVTGDDLQTQTILQCAALPCLLALLSHSKKGIKKEACWTISNITAGNPDQIQAVFDANIIPPLVSILRTAEFEIRKEAAWAISNATSGGTDAQIRFLVSQAVITPLCDLLDCNDPKIVMVALEGIENILRVGKKDADAQGAGTQNQYGNFVEACSGLDKLEHLQHHANPDIFNKASKILETYFEQEGPSTTTTTTSDFSGFQAGASGNKPFSF